MRLLRSHPILVGISALLFVMASLYLSDPLNRFAVGMFYEGVTGGADWKRGFRCVVDLPASASPEEVVNNGYGSKGFPPQILETKRIWIPPESTAYWAVRRKNSGVDGQFETLLLYFQPGPNVLHPGSAGTWIVKFYY